MLRIGNIELVQFKCYEQKNVQFEKPIALLHGANGVGKTSILDAIYYLCFTKSYFVGTDALLTQQGKTGWRVAGTFHTPEPLRVSAVLRETGKKEFRCNDVTYAKIAQHIGRFPCVMIAPDDIAWITGTSEIRRTFLDRMIAQTNTEYLQALSRYNRTLSQRNALLKQFAEGQMPNPELIDFYNNELHNAGTYIYTIRTSVCEQFIPRVQTLYKAWSPNAEEITWEYDSALHHQSLLRLLETNYAKDVVLHRTTKGIHRDDLVVQMQGMPFKQVASQGQRKALLFAIKLAERDFIYEQTGIAPILLLDDLFEKLDAERMERLIDCLVETGSQLIVTDTHNGRARMAFQRYAEQCEEIAIE